MGTVNMRWENNGRVEITENMIRKPRKVDSVNKHGTLLQVVQVLTDMNLIIKKAYISSDGGWFMDVFHVCDYYGSKIRDEEVINYIQKTIESDAALMPSVRESVGVMPADDYTSIELSGIDRPGLLSEVCAVLADLECNVVNGEIWTHNSRAAAVVNVTDSSTGSSIIDPERLLTIKNLLRYVLKGNSDYEAAQMRVSPPGTHKGRRLHQIMFDDRDYERMEEKYQRPHITVADCPEKDYTVVTMRSKDRPKLLFDIVCTLTDMKYVVFHGMVSTGTTEAYQVKNFEFYIRDIDGRCIRSEAERKRVIQCLEAAIERRASEGLELELCTDDRAGLLSDTTRIFRENGLAIRRAEISTKNGKAINTFYVTDVKGNPVDPIIINSIREQIGITILQVKQKSYLSRKPAQETIVSFLLASIFKRPKSQILKPNTYCN
ncbi:ACT domain-containing protein ACR6-like isoform X3 [Silene latifolia]|uniref:ACT domain-containing protein ACR6-like isoform X3 n=1 Tax=Silene latifolia TaxID=37657 RepID=UPI003D7765F1